MSKKKKKKNPLPLDLNTFARGAVHYLDHYLNDQKQVRIVLNVHFPGILTPVPAITDTGGAWSVISPGLFEKIANQAEPLRRITLNIRGSSYQGWLYRVTIRLEARIGESIDVDATVFVPDVPSGEWWHYPNFLGLQGFLDRFRWAVDPASNLFFFGYLF